MSVPRPAQAVSRAAAFETSLGWIAAAESDHICTGLTLGHRSKAPAIRALARLCEFELEECAWHRDLAARLCDYTAGDPVPLDDVAVDWTGVSRFARRVLQACRRIPYGQTRSYTQLAQTAGSPRAARAVGNVMASNRHPLLVPCHRVVTSSGALGGFSAPSGTQLKQRLLDLEQGLWMPTAAQHVSQADRKTVLA